MDLVEIKTAELIGPALDWAVAKAAGHEPVIHQFKNSVGAAIYQAPWAMIEGIRWQPSADWSQGGPLIEKHGIEVFCNLSTEQASRFKDASPDWRACMNRGRSEHSYGTTPLIAAMRCLVASKLGDTVQTPSELIQ